MQATNSLLIYCAYGEFLSFVTNMFDCAEYIKLRKFLGYLPVARS